VYIRQTILAYWKIECITSRNFRECWVSHTRTWRVWPYCFVQGATANQKRGPSRFIAAATHRYPTWRQTCCQGDGGRESLFCTPWHARAPRGKQPPLTLGAHAFPARSKPPSELLPSRTDIELLISFYPRQGSVQFLGQTVIATAYLPVVPSAEWPTAVKHVSSCALGRPILQGKQRGRNETSNPNSYQ
jgi:hypothetical protein